MSNSSVAVLDFGSSKLTVLVGELGVAKNLKLKARGGSEYAGFMDGEFLEPHLLKSAIQTAIDSAQSSLKKKIKKLIVGVPAEFCYNENVMLELNFSSKTKIKQRHLNKLFNLNKNKVVSENSTVINKVPIFYMLDDGNKINDPVGGSSSTIKCFTSYLLADNAFISLVGNSLKALGINNFEFVSSNLVEALYLVSAEQREKGAILINTGFITTSVSHIVGDCVVDLKSFSLGGGHITSDLSELLKIPFNSAEQLKRKLVVSLDSKPKDFYEILIKNSITKFYCKTTNDISLARIDMICETILKCFEEFSYEISPACKVYLTGGGLSYIKGIRDYISKYLNFEVEIISPSPLQLNKPELSSEVSLLEISLKMQNL